MLQDYLHRILRRQPGPYYANPAVATAMLNVVAFWLERGVDGFRLDAVPFLFEEKGSRCEGLPEFHAFLQRVQQQVDASGRAVLLLDEAIQPVRVSAPYLAERELHAAFDFVLTPQLFAPAVRSAGPGPGCRWALPLRNHDELGMGLWPGLRDRDPKRTPMAWTSVRNGGFCSAPDPLLVLPPIPAPGYDCRLVNVEVQQRLSGSLLNWHRRMLTSRGHLPALRHGDYSLLASDHPSVLCCSRSTASMALVIAANVSGAGAATGLDLSAWQGCQVREVLWGCGFPPAGADWFVYRPAYGADRA